jgi:hypothetical protein
MVQLPHQVLHQIGMICNQMMGPQSSFPGPIMPQLPFDRNMMVLLGSYMSSMAFNFTRLAPLL